MSRCIDDEISAVKESLHAVREWKSIGNIVLDLAGEYFLVTGSGKYMRNVKLAPEENIAVIKIDATGENYGIVWGLVNGERPTGELPTHLANHEFKKKLTGWKNRVIYHAHPINLIALTFVLPLKIADVSTKLMEKYRVVVWAHHGLFACGDDFDEAFGFMNTVEKSG